MTRDEELALLIEEQRADDTHIVRPDRVMRYGLRLDHQTDNDKDLSNLIGVDEDGEVVSFIRAERGEILVGAAPWHGTEDGYTNHRCRCPRCRQANTVANHKRRQARKSRPIPAHVEHGTEHCYGNYGCRCGPCRVAHSQARRDYRERKAAA